MTIYYLSPLEPDAPPGVSGGTRKLFDHICILKEHGFDAELLSFVSLLPLDSWHWTKRDLVIIPECFGDGHHLFPPPRSPRPNNLDLIIPRGIPRIYYVQNSYLVDVVDSRKTPPGLPIVRDPVNAHPYETHPDVVAIFTESQHTEDRLRERFPNLKVPLIRTHSSGNGRMGKDAGFYYGPWPRKKHVFCLEYKHGSDSKENLNAQVFADLPLPEGWRVVSISDLKREHGIKADEILPDEFILEEFRTAAIFAAPNYDEGMCAPTQEAQISGCVNVVWPGGPAGQTEIGGPMEYLAGRGVIAVQDDVQALRDAIVRTAEDIDANPDKWAKDTAEWSAWHRATYSREREIAELLEIFTDLGYGSRKAVA